MKEAETASSATPQALALLFERARALDVRGQDEEARRAYLEVLHLDPDHFEALLGLAALCVKMKDSDAATTALRHAVDIRPESALAHSNLATLLMDGGDIAAARQHYEEALRLDPRNRGAHQGLAVILLRLGERESARQHGRLGFGGRAEAWPFRGTDRPISLLLTISAIGGNLPIPVAFIDDRVFSKWTILSEFVDPAAPLPPHDLVFNLIGDADRCSAALTAASEILSRTRAPILNAPARILATARAANADRLGKLPGVVTAHTVEWSRTALLGEGAPAQLAASGFRWPLLVRSPGFHTGQHFEKVEGPDDLRRAVEALPGDKLLVMQFIDTRNVDGQFRKYRVMIVDGQLYPLHLAVSSHWKVHYVTADMAEHPENRAEDEAFLKDMAEVLGPGALGTVERIRDQLGLDYGGVDFGFDGQGNMVVFEANATMIILPPSGDERWAYRVAPVDRVRQALERMLRTRAVVSGHRTEGAKP